MKSLVAPPRVCFCNALSSRGEEGLIDTKLYTDVQYCTCTMRMLIFHIRKRSWRVSHSHFFTIIIINISQVPQLVAEDLLYHEVWYDEYDLIWDRILMRYDLMDYLANPMFEASYQFTLRSSQHLLAQVLRIQLRIQYTGLSLRLNYHQKWGGYI